MLREMAKKLPEKPGVYIMKDSYDNIIYIGKAKNLKNRVSQYFQSSTRHSPKIVKMIDNIKEFQHILADTELEALLLECRMIKDLKPMYNSQMKNDLGYVYLRLVVEDKFPNFEVVEERIEEGVFYGPYGKLKSVERALMVLQDNFKIRHCKSLKVKESGCMKHQLGLCLAPCTGCIDNKTYMEQVNQVVDFLEGRNLELIKLLESKMTAAAEAMDFIKAAKYRDDAKVLRGLVSRQKALGFSEGNRSIAAIEKIGNGEAKLFILQGSRIVFKVRLRQGVLEKNELVQYIRDLILTHIKAVGEKAVGIDKQEVDQAHILYSYLKNKKDCSYSVIPKAWLKKNNISKLEQGIEKLIEYF